MDSPGKRKSVVEIAIGRMPPPHKLGKGYDEESESGEEDGDGLEQAIAEFFKLGKAGNYAEAASAFRDAMTICSESEEK